MFEHAWKYVMQYTVNNNDDTILYNFFRKTSELQIPTLNIKIKYSRLFSALNVHILTFFLCCLFLKMFANMKILLIWWKFYNSCSAV